MFTEGDYVVCPGHGVGQVLSIEDKDLGGTICQFYNIKIIANGMKIIVPTNNKEGVRGLVNEQDVEDVFELLKTHDVKVDNSTWNRRHREYMNKLKTGSLLEIADVLRQLLLLSHDKNLSFGERKMLDLCKELLVKEIAITVGDEESNISNKIDSCFS